jgi:hypothetical protein
MKHARKTSTLLKCDNCLTGGFTLCDGCREGFDLETGFTWREDLSCHHLYPVFICNNCHASWSYGKDGGKYLQQIIKIEKKALQRGR